MKWFLRHKIRRGALFIAILLFAFGITVPNAFAADGYTWTDQSAAGDHYWNALATSSDGKYVAASNGLGTVMVSSDYGVTWVNRTPPVSGRFWYGLGMSADGSHIAVGDTTPGDIWTSTNYGVSWTDQTAAGSNSWSSLSMSANGSRILATTFGGDVDLSTDGGSTWNPVNISGSYFMSGSSSSSGQYLAAVDAGSSPGGGYVYTSSDYGATWTQRTSAGLDNWGAVNISPDGSRMFAANDSHIYYSTNHGASWSLASGITGSIGFRSISSSNAGQYVVADGQNSATVWLSTDYGVHWTADTTPTTLTGWNASAMSLDGSRLLVTGNNDGGGADIWSAYNSAALDNSLVPVATPSLPASTQPTASADPVAAPDTGYGAPHNSAMLLYVCIASLISVGVGIRKLTTDKKSW